MIIIANIGNGIRLAVSGNLAAAAGYRVTFLIIAGQNPLALPCMNAILPAPL